MIGQPVLRREDRRFVAGQARYACDVPIGSALSVVVVRSPHALNPLHVKGTGEGSAVPGPAAIADALGIELTECPVRAERLGRSVHLS